MSRFDADAFFDSIRTARKQESKRPARGLSGNLFDVGDFLHSIHIADQIEILEAARAAGGLAPDASDYPLYISTQPADVD